MHNLQFLFGFSLVLAVCSNEQEWTGHWFPDKSDTDDNKINESVSTEATISNVTWGGKWFPDNPSNIDDEYKSFERDRIMGIPNGQCDDAQINLHNDFDPKSSDHSMRYLCLEPTYTPNYSTEPIETIYDVPKFYTPVHKCMNETITYDQSIPTVGYHRPLWAAYGQYEYLPPQRWLHNIEHGAIVALYHKCANQDQINQLKSLVKGCLFRHVITPFDLTQKRPFALVAWSVSLEFSVLDEKIATDFIKKYAKQAPEKVSRDGQYSHLLTEPAKILSDVDDSEICPSVTVM